MNSLSPVLKDARKSPMVWFVGLTFAVAAWFALYNQLLPFAKYLVGQMPIEHGSHLAASVEFFP